MNWTFKLFSKIGSVGFDINNLCPLINLVKSGTQLLLGVFFWGGGGGGRIVYRVPEVYIKKQQKFYSLPIYAYQQMSREHIYKLVENKTVHWSDGGLEINWSIPCCVTQYGRVVLPVLSDTQNNNGGVFVAGQCQGLA